MFYKYKHTYNPKIDFLFIYHLNPYYNCNENYNEVKQIYRNNIIPSSKQGYEFRKLLCLFKYLYKNKRKKLITFSKAIKETLNANIDFGIYNNEKIKNITFDKSIDIMRKIYNVNKNEKYCIEIGLLILNNSLKMNKYLPIIFHHRQILIIEQLIKQSITKKSLEIIIDKLNNKTKHYLKKFRKKSKKQMIKLLQKQTDIYEQFNIKKVWLFGSFSNDNSTKYSDVDLIIEVDEIDLEEIKRQLKNRLKRTTDIHVENETNIIDKQNIKNDKIIIYESRGN